MSRLLRGTFGDESKLSKVSSSSTAERSGVGVFPGVPEFFFLNDSTASVLWILCSDMRSGCRLHQLIVVPLQQLRHVCPYRHEEVANRSGQVQQAARTQGLHQLGDAAQLVQVVGDAHERQEQQHVAIAGVAVLAQDMEHLGGVLVARHHAAVGPLAEEVEEAVCGMAVVAGEREQGELTVAGEM
jgi:hypothetical protein